MVVVAASPLGVQVSLWLLLRVLVLGFVSESESGEVDFDFLPGLDLGGDGDFDFDLRNVLALVAEPSFAVVLPLLGGDPVAQILPPRSRTWMLRDFVMHGHFLWTWVFRISGSWGPDLSLFLWDHCRRLSRHRLNLRG